MEEALERMSVGLCEVRLAYTIIRCDDDEDDFHSITQPDSDERGLSVGVELCSNFEQKASDRS